MSTLAPYTGIFSLTASNANASFDGQSIQASGYNFFIGRATSTFCPDIVQQANDCPAGTETVFVNGAMVSPFSKNSSSLNLYFWPWSG